MHFLTRRPEASLYRSSSGQKGEEPQPRREAKTETTKQALQPSILDTSLP